VLKTLTVSNFALIEQAVIDFSTGLNILTGETGAGKSILVDALNILLGGRASSDAIRGGSDFFRVEAIFTVENNVLLQDWLDGQGILREDDTLIISRYLSRQGKSVITVNSCHVTASALRQIGAQLLDMHGQHENQSLLKPESYLKLLDDFVPELKGILADYFRVYSAWSDVGLTISKTEGDARERAQRIDMLRWQTQEIAAADLLVDEEETLDAEIHILANAEKIINSVNRSYILLNEGDRRMGGILSALAETKKELETAARYDPTIVSQLSFVTDALYQLDETAVSLRGYCETLDFNPDRLAILQDRLDIILKLKKKYGATIADVLDYHKQAENELALISNYEERLTALKAKHSELEKQLARGAEKLENLRRNAAEVMAERICGHLGQLGMPKARLIIAVNNTARYTATGSNEVAIMFSANLGEEPKPLQKVASGGELSRLALAIKAVSASSDAVGTMVFDEVDAGVGGQIGQMVAEKIALVSRNKQVLCITHLPQIAAMADYHISVTKTVVDERTRTEIKILKDDDHRLEVAKMISGDNITPAALKNAAEMVIAAEIKKRNMEI